MVFKYGEYVGLEDAVRRSLSCEENHFDESCRVTTKRKWVSTGSTEEYGTDKIALNGL